MGKVEHFPRFDLRQKSQRVISAVFQGSNQSQESAQFQGGGSIDSTSQREEGEHRPARTGMGVSAVSGRCAQPHQSKPGFAAERRGRGVGRGL